MLAWLIALFVVHSRSYLWISQKERKPWSMGELNSRLAQRRDQESVDTMQPAARRASIACRNTGSLTKT
jgi:hypothetical protein